jgi:spermidine synthase
MNAASPLPVRTAVVPTWTFGVAIALGACLLFQVQFVLAKLILPWFGGSPSVWSTALLAFQTLLLVGYAYAHALTSLPSTRQQTRRHVALLVVVLVILAWRALAWPSPITPDDTWKPDADGSPVRQILLLLTGAVGLPFVLLASTSPLLQRWYAETAPGRSPYRLYALSNLGSLLGLLSYPFLLEPRLDVFQQGRLWALGYLVFAAVTALCARVMLRAVDTRDAAPAVAATVDPRPVTDAEVEANPVPLAPARPLTGDYVMWLLLSAVPSALLQATTAKITQDIAAAPFLWMVPLALYLFTFVIAFEYPRLYRRHIFALLVAAVATATMPEWSTRVELAITLGMLTTAGLSLHGELAARAPVPAFLTRYFLVVSAGGVIGSALVALGAPIVFDGLVEYPLTLVAALLVLGAMYLMRRERDEDGGRGPAMVAVAFATLGGLLGAKTAIEWANLTSDAVFTSRNFFGAIRVREQEFEDTHEGYRRLQHGTTLHGMQYLALAKQLRPTSYYTPQSGVGRALDAATASDRPIRVGVVGLGTGTLAAYGRKGDAFTFFEIDPQVVALSTAPTPLFTYLRASPAQIDIIGGDARLSLERAAPWRFDVLALDAFSSDAVPVHLLTQEAFGLYARHLRDDRSVLAVHVSNRYLDLEGIVAAAARTAGFHSVVVEHDLVDNDTERTTWMLLARDAGALRGFGEPYEATGVSPWTDASSHLLGVLRR